jgi:hypothetical protein
MPLFRAAFFVLVLSGNQSLEANRSRERFDTGWRSIRIKTQSIRALIQRQCSFQGIAHGWDWQRKSKTRSIFMSSID